jgi:hypothetical protein
LLDAERRSLFMTGVMGEQLPHLTRLHGVAGGWHQIAFATLTEANADRVIAEQVAHYRGRGVSVEWAAYAHDQPADLVARLERQGFEVGEREAVVVFDVGASVDWLSAPCPHRVERVQTPKELRLFADVAERIFNRDQTPIVRELEASLALGSSELAAYIVYDGAVAASVARLYTHPSSPFAGLYGGGTLDGHRGRGLYRAGVQRRALDARQAGARYLRVDALPTSHPILERLGFEVITHLWPCTLSEGRTQ